MGSEEERHGSLRDLLGSMLRSPLRNLRDLQRLTRFDEAESSDVVWALRDVSFEVEQGRAVGIIGRNGAGKSTLLKVLSRITEPSAGRAEVLGRVGSLLEVGTGFHPDLTGRENVYLNGSILGMDRGYIDRQFEAIVSFAGVERYVDTPVKRYSSGMYLRLAFAVAAHLEPEILVVDEVLAVGDAEFQKKCLGKMGEVAGEGRTVLFVSHQMASIQRLCDSVVWLDQGTVRLHGATEATIAAYLAQTAELARTPLADRGDRSGNGAIRFTALEIQDSAGRSAMSLRTGGTGALLLHFEQRSRAPLADLHVSVGLNNAAGQRISILSTDVAGDSLKRVPAGEGCVRISLGPVPLVPGTYGLTLFARADGAVADWVQDGGQVQVESGDFFKTGRLPPQLQGDFLIPHEFELLTRSRAVR